MVSRPKRGPKASKTPKKPLYCLENANMVEFSLPVGFSVKQKDSKSIGLAIGLENIFRKTGFRKQCIFVVEIEQNDYLSDNA